MESIEARQYEINELLMSFLCFLSLCLFLPKVTSVILSEEIFLLQTQGTTGNKVESGVTEGVSSAPTKATTAPGSPVSIATPTASKPGTLCNVSLSSCAKPHTIELFLACQQLSFQPVPPTNYQDVCRFKLKWPICKLNISVKVSIFDTLYVLFYLFGVLEYINCDPYSISAWSFPIKKPAFFV